MVGSQGAAPAVCATVWSGDAATDDSPAQRHCHLAGTGSLTAAAGGTWGTSQLMAGKGHWASLKMMEEHGQGLCAQPQPSTRSLCPSLPSSSVTSPALPLPGLAWCSRGGRRSWHPAGMQAGRRGGEHVFVFFNLSQA